MRLQTIASALVALPITMGTLAVYWNKPSVVGTAGMRIIGALLAAFFFVVYWLLADVVITRLRSRSRKDP